jgi:ring-1,2-phenylacetyl-CoA epoxidase subunit PaaD
VSATSARVAAAWQALAGVPDPEVPAISIVELGIVRDVIVDGPGVCLVLTPTYSGCPATAAIEDAARAALAGVAGNGVRVDYRHAPAWTTDWIAPEGRDKLRAFGIAPPARVQRDDAGNAGTARRQRAASTRIDVTGLRARPHPPVACPRCGSMRTARLSQFGSTACKAQWRCLDCLEPFDHFKAH